MKVFKHFLNFLKTFDSCQVHNMLALMLDPHFKSLWVVESFVGHGNVIHLITKYNVKEVIPLLMTFLDQLNRNVEAVVAP
jgi:hypothetical protein